MTQPTGEQVGLTPHLVLSDSTLQHMLAGRSYGLYQHYAGYVLSCPGASLALGTTQGVPSIVELLYWQFGQMLGSSSFTAPCQDWKVGEGTGTVYPGQGPL